MNKMGGLAEVYGGLPRGFDDNMGWSVELPI